MTTLEVLQAGGLVNVVDMVAAADLEGVPLYVAVAFTVKETGGRNIYGHDPGGAMYGAGEVTAANFAEFTALVAAGARSNGVGPLQITWPGFFPDAVAQGLDLSVPLDNFRYGFRLIRGYLADETDAAIVAAGTRYNGSSTYGQSLLLIARQWKQLLLPAPSPPKGNPMATNNTAAQALARSRTWKGYNPVGMCAKHVSDSVSNGALGYGQVGSAKDAWNLATQKVTDGSTPPPGAPVYWSTYWGTGRWGHIALSTGGGRGRSTDYPSDTLLGEDTLGQIGKRWPGMKYLGWSRDFAGDPIPGLEKPAPPKPVPAPQPPKGDLMSQIDALNAKVDSHYQLETARYSVGTGRYKVAAAWQAETRAAIASLRAAVADHEARIVALERPHH